MTLRPRCSATDAAKFEAARRAREPGRCASCPHLFSRPGWMLLIGMALGFIVATATPRVYSLLSTAPETSSP